MRFFLINQSDYGIKPTYLSVSKIVSPIFWLKLQPVFSLLLSLSLNPITHQSITLITMSSSEPEKTPDMPLSLVARKQLDSNATTIAAARPSPLPRYHCCCAIATTLLPHCHHDNTSRVAALPLMTLREHHRRRCASTALSLSPC